MSNWRFNAVLFVLLASCLIAYFSVSPSIADSTIPEVDAIQVHDALGEPGTVDAAAAQTASANEVALPAYKLPASPIAQTLSPNFWQAIAAGQLPQPGSTLLIVLLVGIISLFTFRWWFNRRQRLTTEPPASDQAAPMNVIAENPLGWLLTIIIPWLVYGAIRETGVDENIAMFTGIISISLIMWMFALLPDFIPALLAALLLLLFGIAPSDVILAGFSSPSFFLTFSILGLGVVITSSGLTYRYTLILLKNLPPNTFWYQVALFFTGILFTPIVPSIAGRAGISAPILSNMTKGLDDASRCKAGGMLYSSGLDSVSFLSAIFLTSAPANLIIFGMLPVQEQQAFQVMYWVYAASVVGTVMLVLYFITSALFFRAYQHIKMDKTQISAELKRLGPISWREWSALIGIVVLALGILSTSVHKIDIAHVAFLVLFVLLFLGVLTRTEFIKNIDWAFIFMLGGTIGIVTTINHLGIDKLLQVQLFWLGDYMSYSFELFILMLSGITIFVRIFLSINTSILILATALLPLANASGVSPWLVGFIILLMAETSIFNFQSPHITFFREHGKGELVFKEWPLILFRILLIGIKLLAIYISIPFWRSIGVL